MAYKNSQKMVERKQARRRRFLGAAIALFGRIGYHAATVPMIVAQAESSTGAFYLYFRNKEDIYAEALHEIATRLSAELNAAIAPENRPENQMAAAVEGFARWLAGNPGETHMLAEAAALGGRLEEVRRSIIESHVSSVAAALESAAPWLGPTDRPIVARCWVGATIEAAQGWLQMDLHERPDASRLAAIVKKFNLQGAGIQPISRPGDSGERSANPVAAPPLPR